MRNLGKLAIAACMLFTVGTLAADLGGLRKADNTLTVDGIHARECRIDQGCMIVPPDELANLLKANAKLAEERDAAIRERDMLRESKGCARLTVPPGGRGA